MDLTQRFTEAGHQKCLSVKELALGRPYTIMNVARKSTKFGNTLLVTLQDGEDILSIFLPKRYVCAFTDEDIKNINDKVIKYTVIYNGVNDTDKSYMMSLQML
jgi:hypothetical protein